MKNILFIDTGFEYGGGTKSFLYLLKHIDKTKYNIYVYFENDYTYNNKNISKIIETLGCKFIKTDIKKKSIRKIKKEFIRIFSKDILQKQEYKLKLIFSLEFLTKISNLKIDLIHLNNHFGTNLEYIKAANQLGIPVIQHLRKNSELKKWQINILKNCIFNTISVSKATYNFYYKYLKIDENIIFNPFPIDIKPYTKNDNEIKILFPANYLENKGHKLVFKAFNNINTNITLYIAGIGTFDKYTKQLLQKNERIIELGFINLNKYYKDVDYVISFSENEGLPRVVIEGLLYGCGIISSNYEVSKEIYQTSEQRNFYIIERNSEKLEKLLKSLPIIKRKIPDLKIKKLMSIENYIHSIENLYKSLI